MIAPIITDAMVDKAWDAAMDKADAPELNCSSTMIRAALEAIAPDIARQARAEGMREASKIANSGSLTIDGITQPIREGAI